MARIDIHDRAAIERAYPPDAFASDAARNDAPDAVQHGIRIGQAPGADGVFEMDRATRHAGEAETPAFRLATLRPDQPDRGYAAFLDDVVAAAKRIGFRPEESPGFGEPRLRGFRGG